MADFDAQQAQVNAQALQNQFDNAQARIAYLEQSVIPKSIVRLHPDYSVQISKSA